MAAEIVPFGDGALLVRLDTVTSVTNARRARRLAAAIDALWPLAPARLVAMGHAGRERVAGITWDHVIDTLTEGLR